MMIVDFNAEPAETAVYDFCIHNLANFVKERTCFKNRSKPICIDLIVTNRPKFFQSTMVIETGLSDFHKTRVTYMNMYYNKKKPSIIHSRKLKNFCNETFIKM